MPSRSRKNQGSDRSDDKTGSKIPVLSSLLDKLSISLYGATKESDVDGVNDRFNNIIQTQLDRITDNGENSLNSFLGKLYTDDKDTSRRIAGEGILDQLQLNTAGTNPQDFFTEQYKNRMAKQAMAQEISNQLIELRHAKEIMCDAITSSDTATGSITRKLDFDNTTLANTQKDYTPILEAMEGKFSTLTKIKNFIVPNLLSYGEYYVYTIPYYHLFNEFIRRYRRTLQPVTGTVRFYEEGEDGRVVADSPYIEVHTLYEESGDDEQSILQQRNKRQLSRGKEKEYIETGLSIIKSAVILEDGDDEATFDTQVKSDLDEIFTKRITVSEGEIPVPILEEGFDAFKDFTDTYITEDGTFMEEGVSKKKSTPGSDPDLDMYLRKYGAGVDDGTYNDADDDKENYFDEGEIKDCYIKMIPPTRMIPIEMMGKTLFYVYIQTSPATPLSTILSYNTQIKTKDPNNKMNMLLDDISSRIVSKFSKSFVKDNLAFKEQIVAALEYYDIANTNIHFQVIPVEYVTAFKINVDVDGHGHSMLEPSLFYANIYLSMLIFKVMTILTKSTDHTVNYIRRSGIDKNLWNDVQDIIRRKQRRRITLNDIFSYTNVINKAGAGSEEFIGMTKSGEKPIESEIISGQDVQLDTPLMERVRSDMILGTDVPSAIMNFLNEADFAKSIETANTKMNAKVMSCQIDINNGCTDWYKKLARFSTNIPKQVIDTIVFALQEPKGSANIATQELINNYQTLQEFLLKLFAGENVSENEEERRKQFLRDLADMFLPGIPLQKIEEIWERSAIVNAEKNLVSNGDEDNDLQI